MRAQYAKFILLIGGLSALPLMLSGCQDAAPGVRFAQSIIFDNDQVRENRAVPHTATELIAYRNAGIVGTSAALIANYLEEAAEQLYMPINIHWKDEQSSGLEALHYANAALQSDHQFLLLYTPEMMMEDLHLNPPVYTACIPVSLLAKEQICFAVRADSPLTSLDNAAQCSADGIILRTGGSSISGGLDELRFNCFMGLAPNTYHYQCITDRSPLFALLDGTLDIVCVPVSQAAQAVSDGLVRILPCPAFADGTHALSTNWLCVLAPNTPSNTDIAFWVQSFDDLSHCALWESVRSKQNWFSAPLAQTELTHFLAEQDRELRTFLQADP